MRTFLLSFGILLASAHIAAAGYCIDTMEKDLAMKGIEAFAKDKKTIPPNESLDWECAEMDAIRFKTRIERTCRMILDRDGIKSPCARLAALAGFAKLGDHDLYTLVLKQPEDPVQWESVQGFTRAAILGRMGDPRGVSVILETWKAAIPRAAKNEKRRDRMQAWSVWRQQAATALGAIGGQVEIPFLDEQAKTTKDTYVAKECRNAMAAIEKRVNAAAPAAPLGSP